MASVIWFLYLPTRKYGYVVDDVSWIKKITGGNFKIFSGGKVYWRNIFYRLYGCGTLGKDKTLDHTLTTLLHITTSCLIYFALGTGSVAWITAMLYAVHPCTHQTSIWLNGRRYQINIILTLLMMILGPVGMILYPLTLKFQVTAILAPILLGWWGLLALPLGGLMMLTPVRNKIADRIKKIRSDDHLKFTPKKLIPITKLYASYIAHMVLPRRCYMVYSDFYYWGLTEEGNKKAYAVDLHFWLGVTTLLGSLVGTILLYGTPLFFMAAFTSLSILMWCGWITVVQWFTDRYIALPLIFVVHFVVLATLTFLPPTAAWAVLGGLTAYYAVKLREVMPMYKSLDEMNRYHIYHLPDQSKCREFAAARCLQTRNVAGAWVIVSEGLKHNYTDMKLLMLAAHCMHLMGDRDMVLHYLNAARKHCYIGQENILDAFQKDIFGIDIEAEVKKIDEKTSAFDRKQREQIKKVHAALTA